ncbi:PhzF family phenazine biosynthesis protein [Micromonospora sp. WMMA1363]|uniref:PhzF family phenazine biosynthesis protein n=1 Tax=Micromonospora sp. WMMA1363 TaxID=3053985 RepID=UPI00259C9D95|nr:PhzF family phenazine biosynthesis protein [Micromonospora sp. WMMA1363]MDM4722874.1 PhzF family phenazine biosynthesis protein [Micromonospora sp. WMMA1363]
MRRRFFQIDVFGAEPYLGNPVAVVSGADGLTTAQMQALTRWTNLSECTFLLPPTTPDADYRVRIFTLAREIPFAGHPTLGSCQAWLAAGGIPRQAGIVVQESGVGLVPVRISREGLAFAAPPLIRSGPVDGAHRARVTAILGLTADQVVDIAWIDNGPGWVGVLVPDAATVLALQPDRSPYTGPGSADIGVVGPYLEGHDPAFELRAFYSDAHGEIREDPVTGSLNASVAQWLISSGRATAPYRASQGATLGRRGRVHIDQDTEGTIWVGGTATVCIDGWTVI